MKGGKNDRHAAKPAVKPQPKKNEYEKPVKAPKPTGAIPELEVFDYSSGRIDARLFNQAKLKLIDYAAIHYERVSDIIEIADEFDFKSSEPTKAPLPEDAAEELKKLSNERYV